MKAFLKFLWRTIVSYVCRRLQRRKDTQNTSTVTEEYNDKSQEDKENDSK